MVEDEGADLEAIRRKKMQETISASQADEELRKILVQILEPEAYTRLSNVKLSNPENYRKVAMFLMQLARSGQLKSRVGEEQLRAILLKLTAAKPQGSISFKRK